jgi:outer membrane protein assembly factor BamA
MKIILRLLLLSLLSLACMRVHAQDVIAVRDSSGVKDSSLIKISAINIEGNKRTKSYIIIREMQVHLGDSIRKDKLEAGLLQARNQIYNTNLFTEVKVDSAYLPDGSLTVNVVVHEKWYIYPTPQFQLADRSFNEWIKTYHADLNRVIYGVKFAHYNFSGRRDQLRAYLLNGYARNISISYSNPYSNKALNRGFAVSAGFTQNKEIAVVTTYNNKQLFFKKDGFVRNSFGASGAVSRRNGFFRTRSFAVGINYINIADTVIKRYNPDYFNSSKSYQFFPGFSYSFRYINTNNNNYPLKGRSFGGSLSKTGLGFSDGINSLTFAMDYAKYFPHPHNWYSSVQLAGFIRLPFELAYVNRRAMGFGGFYLRGLEDYVIDGAAAGIAKYTLSKKIIAFDIPVPFHIKSLPVIPIKVFAKTYADAGYAYTKQKYDSKLNNKFLYSGGFGIDILTFYDINIKLEYSFNQLGEKGLFLHGKSGF